MKSLTSIFAVFKKELKIALRYPSWFMQLIIWPVALPFGYIFTARALSGKDASSLNQFQSMTNTTDYITFILIGTTIWMLVNSMLWSFGSRLRVEQIRGTLESNWLCPVPKINIQIGHALFDLVTNLIFVIVSLIEFKIFFNFNFAGSPLLAFLVLILSIPSIYGIGFIFSSLVIWAKEINSMVFLVRGIISIFCGITYPLTVLPNWMKSISKIIPMTHTINALRSVIAAGANLHDISYEIKFLILSGIILMILGILSFSYTQNKAKATGSLGHY
mgnify:CR=1 FL=1